MRVRKRPGVVGLFVLIAVGGFASTLALGSARGGILPTLSVPSLPVSVPVTTAPLPPAPPVPPVPPAPPPVRPPAQLPTVPPAPPRLQPAAHAATTSPAGAALPSATPTSTGPAPSSASEHSSPHAASAPRASRARFHTGGPGQRGTTITLNLTAPATVVLLVRGPSPGCGVAGRRVVSLGQGVSHVRFLGRFHGRPLAPGTYGISMVARRGGRSTMLGRLAIAVVPPSERIQRSAARPVFAGCTPSSSAAPASSSGPFAGLGLVLHAAARKVTGAGATDRPEASFRPPTLSVPVLHAPVLPGPPGGGPAWLGVLFYGAVLLAGGAMLMLVLGFATRRWNP